MIQFLLPLFVAARCSGSSCWLFVCCVLCLSVLVLLQDTAKVSEHLVGVTPLSEAAAGGSGIELKAGADGKTITGVVGSDAEAAAAGEDTKTSAFTASEAHATLASVTSALTLCLIGSLSVLR